MNIGEQIAKYRKERHFTQEQLGEAVGVTNRTVSKWEAGVSLPGVDLIPSIARALGITLDQLFGLEKAENTADDSQMMKATISSSIKEYLEEYLPNVLEDTLSELLPKYIPSHSKDEYSLLIIGRDKSAGCRFFGQGSILKLPTCYCIAVPTQGDHILFSDYKTKEEAAEDLKRIFQAYAAQKPKIEL